MTETPYILAADTIERRLEFAHWPQGWLALGSIVLCLMMLYAVVFFYRREYRAGASPAVRAFLASTRCLVIILLAVIWLQPVLATYINRKIESLTLLLVDGSASMSMRDRYPNPVDAQHVEKALEGVSGADATQMTRAELTESLLTRDQEKLLQQMAGNNPVQIYQFGDKLTRLAEVRGGKEGERGRGGEGANASQPTDERELATARAPATDIGRAVRQAIESQSGTPIAAVVVFSDGRFNQGEPAEVVARYARGKKIPIHTVGVGDPSPPRNASVTTIEAPPNVFVKDPFKVTAHLRAQGLDGASLNVELLERSGDANQPRVVDTKKANVGTGGSVEPVVFNRQITEASEVTLQVHVVPESGETLLDDNKKETTVRALEGKMRVLLVSGGPTWEYRYLSRLLQRDATMNLSCWLQSADEEAVRDGNTVIDRFPRTQEELFPYDCVILLDPQPNDIDPTWTTHIEAMVGSYGGGLLYVAGRKNTPRFTHDPNTRSLLDLLPVVIEPNEADLIINDEGHFQSTAWPVVVPPEAAGHPVLAMADQPGENMQMWARLPGVYWHYPVRREKPVATVMLRHSSPRMRNSYGGHVLLASQFFGSGRTGFLGFDTTWRWRRFGDRYFNRFWIQLLRHMVEGKLLSGQKRGLIQFERDTYAVGEGVIVEARIVGGKPGPLDKDQVSATLHVEGQTDRTVTLAAQQNRPGWYRGRFVPTEVGTHVLQIDLPGSEGMPAATLRGEVRVGQPDLEFRQPELDRESLETLAAQSAGGKYLNVDEVDQLPSLIPSRTATLVLTGQPITLWDRWWMFALLVVLLGVEWAVRKRARLL